MIFLKKALRSMWENKKTYLACASLIAVGILIYTTMGISSFALEDSRIAYYNDYHMADVFAKVAAAPLSAADEAARLPGVDRATARLSYDARAEIEGNEKIITLRLISFEEDPNSLNQFFVSQGSAPTEENDIILGDDFYETHGLSPGDQINLIIEGREYVFNISGASLSPEFVYTIKDETALFPDPVTFGMAFIRYDSLASILNMAGMANDITLTLQPGVAFDQIKAGLEDMLEKYGLLSLVELKDQLSHYMLDQEIRSIKSMASSLSMVFVMASMIVLYLMLKRLIEQDRAQIGTLKAFGYSSRQVLVHYLTYGAITGLVGGIAGAGLGLLSSDGMLNLYGDFFKMPELKSHNSLSIVIQGLLMAFTGGIAGSYMGAWGIVKLNPAEAMRPKPPKAVKKDILSTLPAIKFFLTSRGNMAVRSIGRSKVRSAFIILGMMFSFGIMAVMNSMDDMIDALMSDQFTKSQVFDGKISLKNPVSAISALEYIYTIDGVDYAETLLEIPVKLKNVHIEEDVLISGLSSGSSLYKLYDGEKKSYLQPGGGITLSSGMAKKLNAARGDALYVSSDLLHEDMGVYVSDIVTEYIGMGSYMLTQELAELMDLNEMATAIIFKSGDIGAVREYLKEGKNILTIDDVKDTQKSMEDMLASYASLLFIMRFMGIFVALAIIYNTSSISLSERKREYATLKVLGLETKEVAEIMGFEYWLLSFAGILLGIPFTRLLRGAISGMMDVELFSIPLHTEPEAFFIAFLGCAAAVYLSNGISKRAIAKFDIVEVLKERE